MIYLMYVLGACAALVGVALSVIATQRNLIIIMLGVELIFLASTVALVGFLSMSQPAAQGGGAAALVAIWAVAAAEIITLVAFYAYTKANGYGLDVSLLSRMRG